jgi:hypothetical protein
MQRVYVIQLVREALAREEGELAVRVEIVRNAILLRGTVPSEARRTRLGGVARALCAVESGGYRVVNELRVRAPAAAGAPEALP